MLIIEVTLSGVELCNRLKLGEVRKCVRFLAASSGRVAWRGKRKAMPDK